MTVQEAQGLAALIKLVALFPDTPKPRGVVYRHLDANGTLLYLGSSDERALRQRHVDHSRHARWWRFVDRVEREYVADRRAAYAACRRAAPKESPIFNRLAHRSVGEQDVGEAFYLVAHAAVDLWPDTIRIRRGTMTRTQKTASDRAMLARLLS